MSELEFWKDLGNIFDAVMNYQKKNVEFNNRFINPWIRLGNVFDRQDQANDAVQAYQRATEIDPNTAQNWVELGDAQFKKGDYDQAIEAYGKAVMLDPEAGWPLGNLALCLVTQGKAEEAIPLYKKSIDLLTEVKDKAICWNRLGNAYRKLNDYENAFFAFQEADHLDGDNTGFSDKLDETPPNTSVVAPEEILEQMIVDQVLEEAESARLEVVSAPAEETGQPETEPVEVELPATDATQVETAEGLIALKPNMEMVVEESVVAEEAVPPLNETSSVEEPVNENTAAEEETPLTLHEKKFDLIQIVENVIAKVERAYAEQKGSDANKEQEAEKVSAEAELQTISEETVQDIEAINAASEEAIQEIEPIATADSDAAPEVEVLVMSEKVSLEDVAEPAASGVESVAAEIKVEVELKIEVPAANDANEEKVSEDETQRVPAWLVMKNIVKTEEKISVIEAEEQQNLVQVESVTTLSDISQEAAVSESAVNMDIVETYTDPLAAQLTTPGEATDQIEGHAEHEAEAEMQETTVADESIPAVESVPEELSAFAAEEQTEELAYEEYLKDVVEPVNLLKDHVDEIQGETPATKISRNGEVRIAMDTKNAHVWNELGNIYLNAGTYDDAIASYSKAIELDRHFAWPYSNLALAYVQKGRFAEAILLYQRGIELFTSDRDKAITWNRLGNVYRRINDYSNAIASYQTADELDPENATLSLRSSFGLLGNMYSDSKPAFVA
jgi:tetratricopeptide (TPR) repeat protein